MKKLVVKIASVGLAGVLVLSSQSVITTASSLSSALPVAGIARALNEGKSVTVVKADMIRQDGGAILETDDNYSIDTEVTTIKETTGINDPALLTVGAGTATVTVSCNTAAETKKADTEDAKKETKKASQDENEEVSDNDVVETVVLDSAVSDDTKEASDEEVDETQMGELLDEDLYDAASSKKNVEEEDFTNLVIAQVNDYVNVRAEASEESEIVGKLYNKSVGELIEEAGDWYKIKSGNCTGYVKGEFVVTGEDAQALAKEVGTRMAAVTTTTLYVRQEPSTDAAVIGMVPMDDELTVSEELDGWVKVSVEEGEGYVSTDFVRLYTEFVRAESKEEEEARLAKEEAARKAAQEAARKAQEKADKAKKNNKKNGSAPAPSVNYKVSGSGTGSSVASYALQFVGNPYVYGGSSLTNGTDCSGFVMSVYRNFGVSLPHSSGGDRGVGYDVGGIGNAQPGDIVCYSGHVGIYIGGGQIVHASTPSSGIKVSSATYRNVLAVRRIF